MAENNSQNQGNNEDIFEIMEKYKAKQAAEAKEEPKSAPVQPQGEVEKDTLVSKTNTPSASKKAIPLSEIKEDTGSVSTLLSEKISVDDDEVDQVPKKSFIDFKGIFTSIGGWFKRLFEPKIPEYKPHKPARKTHGPRPPDKEENFEANISNEALKNHFSENQSDVLMPRPLPKSKEDDGSKKAGDGENDMNISSHLSDKADYEQPVKKKGEILKRIWNGIRVTVRFIYVSLSNLSFIAKSAIYLTVVFIISAFTSYYAITIANDVFAFVKSDYSITVTVPENATDKEIAYLLRKNGIIEYESVFELYLIYKSDEEGMTYIPGEKELNSNMNYNQLIYLLTTIPVENEQISITIPEGFTVDEIIDMLVSKGVGTREGYVEAINNYPYQHEFVKMLDQKGYPKSRKYRLEGYLYPDTYFFYKSSEEYMVINKILNNFQTKFWSHLDVFKADIDKLGMTVDEIVTLASMIQAEAKLFIDFEPVSYVFHNRLSHPDTFPLLQSDATIQYILSEHVEDFTADQLAIDNPYNTYKYKGLPPGAICNPGFDALSAAIYPDSPVDSNGNEVNAYYFVSNKAGKTYYASTLAQHEQNKKTVKKDNEAFNENQNP